MIAGDRVFFEEVEGLLHGDGMPEAYFEVYKGAMFAGSNLEAYIRALVAIGRVALIDGVYRYVARPQKWAVAMMATHEFLGGEKQEPVIELVAGAVEAGSEAEAKQAAAVLARNTFVPHGRTRYSDIKVSVHRIA